MLAVSVPTDDWSCRARKRVTEGATSRMPARGWFACYSPSSCPPSRASRRRRRRPRGDAASTTSAVAPTKNAIGARPTRTERKSVGREDLAGIEQSFRVEHALQIPLQSDEIRRLLEAEVG